MTIAKLIFYFLDYKSRAKMLMTFIKLIYFLDSDIDAVDVDGNTPSHLAQMTSTLATTVSLFVLIFIFIGCTPPNEVP